MHIPLAQSASAPHGIPSERSIVDAHLPPTVIAGSRSAQNRSAMHSESSSQTSPSTRSVAGTHVPVTLPSSPKTPQSKRAAHAFENGRHASPPSLDAEHRSPRSAGDSQEPPHDPAAQANVRGQSSSTRHDSGPASAWVSDKPTQLIANEQAINRHAISWSPRVVVTQARP